jgi:hypothetical protein
MSLPYHIENHISYSIFDRPFLEELLALLTYNIPSRWQGGLFFHQKQPSIANVFYVEIKQDLHYLITMSS